MRRNALRLLTKMALACMLILPFSIAAQAHGRFGGGRGIVVVPRYSYVHPFWGYYWGWGPYWNYGPYYQETRGQVKILDRIKSDQVYINNAYAGTVAKMKTIKLDPGHYTIELRRDGSVLLTQSVYVVAGKTVEVALNEH